LVEAAKYVDKNTEADIIDLNMGCPVPKITKVEYSKEKSTVRITVAKTSSNELKSLFDD